MISIENIERRRKAPLSCYIVNPHVKDKVKKHLFNIKKIVYPEFKGGQNKGATPRKG